MSVELRLVRHGNTFAPGDRIVWVGKGQDLPLVESGRGQAERFGASLRGARWIPTAALSGGLKRQTEHLAIALPDGSPEPIRIDALNEVDYGVWGGLTTEEIEARFGPDEVQRWNDDSVWPVNAGWPETEDEVRSRVQSFLADVAAGQFGERVLACSSNGLLRWFLDAIPGALAEARQSGTFKVKTGHVCRLDFALRDQADWSVTYWNQPPDGDAVR